MNIFLFIGIVFLLTFLIGRILELVRVPWIFAALVLGSLLAIRNPFPEITSSPIIEFMGQLGMYFLLFLVGLEVDIGELRKKGKFILGSSFFIVVTEGLVGSLVIHYIFGYQWLISLLVSLSFATVGEAILIPILDEFHIINTPLGEAIIGIGTADDIIEVLTLIAASLLVGSHADINMHLIFGALVLLFALTFALRFLKRESERFRFVSIETLLLFSLFLLFVFIGIGRFADSAPLAAILAGISLRTFLPKERRELIENDLRAMTYGLFGPIFFLNVGKELNISYLFSYPLLILLVVIVSNSTKIITSLITGYKELGTKGSILLGIGLSVRFSTSIIIIKFLYDKQVIRADLFSVIVASSIVFKFIIPLMFSQLIVRWGFAKKQLR